MKNFLFTIFFSIVSLFSFGQNFSLNYNDFIDGSYETVAYDDTVYLDPSETINVESSFGQNTSFVVRLSDHDNTKTPNELFQTSTFYSNQLPYTYTFQSGFINFIVYVKYSTYEIQNVYKLLVINNETAAVEDATKENLRVYPNPTTDVLNIKVDNYDDVFKVLDLSGRVLLSTSNTSIDVSSLIAGRYLLRVDETVVPFVKE